MKPRDVVGRVRGVDARERLAVGRDRRVPVAAGREQQPRADHVRGGGAELGGCRERLPIASRVCAYASPGAGRARPRLRPCR